MQERWKRGLARPVAAAAWGLGSLLAWLPHGAALAFGRAVADLAHALRIRRTTIDRNLTLVFGPALGRAERARIARSATRNLVLSVVEVLRSSHPRARDEVISHIRFEPDHLYRDLTDDPGGFVVVLAHSGNFDLCGQRFAQDSERRMAVVMKPPKLPPFDTLLVEARRQLGLDVLSVSLPGLLRELIRRVDAGQRVCLLPDQHARKTGVVTTFLGQPVRTHKGPAFVALKARSARVLLAVDTRIDDGSEHVCYFREIEDLEASGDRRTDVARLTQRMNDGLGEIVEKHPGSYLWQHRRWRDLPQARERRPESSSSEASSR